MSLLAYTVVYKLPPERVIAVTVHAYDAVHAEEIINRDSNGAADVVWIIPGDDHIKALDQYQEGI